MKFVPTALTQTPLGAAVNAAERGRCGRWNWDPASFLLIAELCRDYRCGLRPRFQPGGLTGRRVRLTPRREGGIIREMRSTGLGRLGQRETAGLGALLQLPILTG